MGKNYTVSTSIYTGIASSTGLTTNEERTDWQIIANTYDNLVSLTKSKGTLETVSLKLLALYHSKKLQALKRNHSRRYIKPN